MLLLSAHPLGLETSVLAGGPDDPAARVCGRTTYGSIGDDEVLRRYLAEVDVLTFESEFVDVETLRRTLPKDTYVFPRLDVIAQIQDRLPQKRLLDRFKIPTAPWREVASAEDLAAARDEFEGDFVLKQRRNGYDGYGTFVRPKDASVLAKSSQGFIAEAFVAFKREVAVSFVRSRGGKFVTLPLVESVQVDSRCFSVRGPIKHAGLAAIEKRFKKLMNELDYVGILAVEMFDTGRELVVNELAPRVHNSAHYSQNAMTCSQFEYHWRAGLDLPLPKPSMLARGFAMVNLLGEGGDVHLSYADQGFLHWYGKTENRKGRKLGHINTLAENSAAALKRALKWRKDFKL